MIKKSLTNIIPILIILAFFSCTQNAGGPCDYNIDDAKARVVAIEKYTHNDKKLYKVKLKFNKSGLSDEPQLLNEIKNTEIDSAFIERNEIKVGNVYPCTVSERTSGNCTPLFVSFENEFKL